MSVGHGEIVGVVGESGSGKSTVIYSAMGLLGKGGRVASGEIRYKTQDLLKISAEELRRIARRENDSDCAKSNGFLPSYSKNREGTAIVCKSTSDSKLSESRE